MYVLISVLANDDARSLLSLAHLFDTATLPVIRCARGNAAEMVARKLDQKLRDRILNSRGDAYVEAASAPNVGRPGRWQGTTHAVAFTHPSHSADYS